MKEQAVQQLIALGFSAVEADIYVFLLQEAPATGYRISQALGKPLSNTYKAAEALLARGAVLVEEGEPRLYRAVPAEELLGRLEREFLRTRSEAAKALAGLEREAADTGVYQLQSRTQVIARCRAMLERSQQVALLDLFPEPLEELRSAIAEAAARGVLVGVVAYQPTTIPGAEVVVDPAAHQVLQRWPGQWLNLVVDGAECLLSFLETGGTGLYQAIWSGSPYLAWVYHCLQAWALTGPALERQIQEGASLEQLQASVQRYRQFHALDAAGYQSIMHLLGSSARAGTRAKNRTQGEAS